MMLVTNVMVGVLAWAAFAAMDLDNAGAWAVAAGLLTWCRTSVPP